MKSTLLVIVLSATAALAAPTAGAIEKRDPSDKSGKTTMAFTCDDTTIPQFGGDSGQGEGGFGLFSTDMTLTSASGQKIQPAAKDCKQNDGFCSTCQISGGGLATNISVQGCSNPAAGACSMTFTYKGQNFDTEKKQPKCGHEGGGLAAFNNQVTAICFFDV